MQCDDVTTNLNMADGRHIENRFRVYMRLTVWRLVTPIHVKFGMATSQCEFSLELVHRARGE